MIFSQSVGLPIESVNKMKGLRKSALGKKTNKIGVIFFKERGRNIISGEAIIKGSG